MFEAKPRQPRSDRKIDGQVEAYLIALLYSPPSAGYARWKLQLLADKLVELKVIDFVSATAVGTMLKKMTGSPQANAPFVCQMEQMHAAQQSDTYPNPCSIQCFLNQSSFTKIAYQHAH